MAGQWRLQLPSAAVSPEEERMQCYSCCHGDGLNFSLG